MPRPVSSQKVAAQTTDRPQTERWIVDGLEDTPKGRVARVELPSGKTADVLLHDLPDGVKEGDILAVQDGPDGVVARILRAETRAKKARAQAKLEALNAHSAAQSGEEITL